MKLGKRCVCEARLGFILVAGLLAGGRLHADEPDFARDQFLVRGNFHAATFNSDGTQLLTAAGSSSEPSTPVAQLWNTENGRLVREFLGHRATIHCVCFSPDGKRALTGAGNNFPEGGAADPTVRVWDIESGKQIAALDARTTYVESVQFSRDGKLILALCHTMTGSPPCDTAVIWDAATFEKRLVISDVATYCKAMMLSGNVAFSPDGKTVAGMTSGGYRIRLWDAKTGEVLWQIDGRDYSDDGDDRVGFGGIEFSPDGTLLLTACSDNKARTWDVKNGWKTRAFTGRGDKIRAATFCYRGIDVLTAGEDGTVQLWSNETGEEIRRFEHPGPINEMAAAGGNDVRMITKWRKQPDDNPTGAKIRFFASLWDVWRGRELKRFKMGNNLGGIFEFSPKGDRIISTIENGTAKLLDSETGKVIREYK